MNKINNYNKHCPICGRFVSHIQALVSEIEISNVTAYCKKHKRISFDDWIAEDFLIIRE